MKIGIVGSGNLGRVVGLALSNAGHEVFFGARNTEQADHAASFDNSTQKGTNQESAQFGEVIFYTPRDVHPKEVLKDVQVLEDKIVIEVGNWPITTKTDKSDDFEIDPIVKSKSETLQEQIPHAWVVKAFNTITQEFYHYSGNKLDFFDIACFVASDYDDARAIVMDLAADIGFSPIDCGELKQSRLLEAMGAMMRILSRKQGTPWVSFSFPEVPTLGNLKFGERTDTKLKA